jgi:hypothetical protein
MSTLRLIAKLRAFDGTVQLYYVHSHAEFSKSHVLNQDKNYELDYMLNV